MKAYYVICYRGREGQSKEELYEDNEADLKRALRLPDPSQGHLSRFVQRTEPKLALDSSI